MPLFLLICLFCAFGADAQNVVLVDKDLKEPIALASPERSPIDPRFFPVYQQDIDEVMSLTAWYIKMLEDHRSLNLNEVKEAGASKFISLCSHNGALAQFQLNLVTRCGQSGYSIQLINNKDGHKKRLQKLRAFYDYLRNNRFLVEPDKS